MFCLYFLIIYLLDYYTQRIYISDKKGQHPTLSSKHLTLPTSPRSVCSILHYLPV